MAILALNSVNKSFDGLKAVDDLSFSIEKGKITALIGPNGSGKTTVFNIISGFLKPSSGEIVLDGRSLTKMAPYRIAQAGVGRTFQLIRLFPHMSVFENVMLAFRYPIGEKLSLAMLRPNRLIQEEEGNRQRANELIELVEMSHKANAMTSDLSHGQRRLVEIARALALDPKVLLLDEPMSGLFPQMIEKMMIIIRGLRDNGRTICFIEHNMRVVLRLSDKVIVLDHGRKLAEGTTVQIMSDPKVEVAYLGRSRNVVAGG